MARVLRSGPVGSALQLVHGTDLPQVPDGSREGADEPDQRDPGGRGIKIDHISITWQKGINKIQVITYCFLHEGDLCG